MKASNYFFAVLAVCSLCLTSCEKDSLTDNLRLDESNNLVDNAITTRLRGIEFKFNEIIFLKSDDDLTGGDTNGRGGSRSGKGDLDGFGKGQPNLAITGIADSRILNWGSWYVELNLIYNPTDNAVSGTIVMTYPDYGDEVTFAVSGQPAVIIDRSDNSQNLHMQLEIIEGSGRFENKTYEGSALVPSIGSIIDDSGNLRTYLIIDGMLVDN